METVKGIVERITFQNAETGFVIAQLDLLNNNALITMVGTMPGLFVGESIRCNGSWKQHLIYGRQFVVEEYCVELPAEAAGIEKYLSSGLIAGIGPVYASRIVGKFGKETLNVIDKEPQRLSEVNGLGKKRIGKILESWEQQKSIREVMIFLQTLGISPAYAQKIFKVYGNQAIQKVQENPYRLARDISGIGFKTADQIAKTMGIPSDAPQRIDAGIEFVLHNLSETGNVCYPIEDFIGQAAEILNVSKEQIKLRIQVLKEEKRIELHEMSLRGFQELFIWMRSLYVAEHGIAQEIMRIKHAPFALRSVDKHKALEWVQKALNINLAENQANAVEAAISSKMHIITGGPGTGKSTITNAILRITEKLTDEIILAAPTGRAAKRMGEITRKKASTIHSLLEFDFKIGRFKRDRQNPIEADLIIIDEASMIDTFLMYYLLRAIPSSARVILVGDINQLPSVGPGNVLKDIIHSESISVTSLNKIYRQAAGSKIVTNAHAINSGDMPDVHNTQDGDFFFIKAEEPQTVLDQIVSLVETRIPSKFKLNSMSQIQVLAPMKKGIVGIDNLNLVLQQKLNPQENCVYYAGTRFQIGDKVMQVRNDYQRNVYNGDVGFIRDIDHKEKKLIISMDETEVMYEFTQLGDLVLSYAVSIHKYQGSECPCIVIPVHTTHFKLLTRNLLYTGVTRGKRLVVLVGSLKALSIAVSNNEVQKRFTGLCHALKSQI